MNPQSDNPPTTQGSTLVISLLLLTVMSLFGLGAMQGAVVEEKMAHNFRFGEAAFHAAESGLQQAISNHSADQILSHFSGTLAGSSYSTSVSNDSGLYTVVSQATHTISGSQRTLTLQLSGPPGTIPTLVSWQSHE